jgi:hypothetical protein
LSNHDLNTQLQASSDNLQDAGKKLSKLNKPRLSIEKNQSIALQNNNESKEPFTNKHGKVQNHRLIKQSKYGEVLRKHNAIPEVGTTQQQMRKQYDEKLSENQLQKLMGKQILITN